MSFDWRLGCNMPNPLHLTQGSLCLVCRCLTEGALLRDPALDGVLYALESGHARVLLWVLVAVPSRMSLWSVQQFHNVQLICGSACTPWTFFLFSSEYWLAFYTDEYKDWIQQSIINRIHNVTGKIININIITNDNICKILLFVVVFFTGGGSTALVDRLLHTQNQHTTSGAMMTAYSTYAIQHIAPMDNNDRYLKCKANTSISS